MRQCCVRSYSPLSYFHALRTESPALYVFYTLSMIERLKRAVTKLEAEGLVCRVVDEANIDVGGYALKTFQVLELLDSDQLTWQGIKELQRGRMEEGLAEIQFAVDLVMERGHAIGRSFFDDEGILYVEVDGEELPALDVIRFSDKRLRDIEYNTAARREDPL